MIDLTKTFEYRRLETMRKWNIDFDFLYEEYELRQCPIDRKFVRYEKTLEYYCSKVRELNANINEMMINEEDKYMAQTIKQHFDSVLPRWEIRIGELEKHIYDYYRRFILINGELN